MLERVHHLLDGGQRHGSPGGELRYGDNDGPPTAGIGVVRVRDGMSIIVGWKVYNPAHTLLLARGMRRFRWQ